MGRLLLAILLGMIALGVVAPAARAQDEQPEAEVADESKPYVPPPAWKSVEIANYYLKRKKYRAALSRYQEAVKTDPAYAPSYLGMGKAYEKIGLKQLALEAYRHYLDALPSAKDAEEAKDVRQAIARLQRQLKTPRAAPQGKSSRADPAARSR